MKIRNEFSLREIELLEKEKIDLDKEYDLDSLEELEEIVYTKMMDNLNKNQDFTPLAEEYEDILNIIIKIKEN